MKKIILFDGILQYLSSIDLVKLDFSNSKLFSSDLHNSVNTVFSTKLPNCSVFGMIEKFCKSEFTRPVSVRNIFGFFSCKEISTCYNYTRYK